MKKFQIVAMILFIFIYLGLDYFDFRQYKKDREVYLSDLNITIVDIPKKILIDLKKIISGNASLWDMKVNNLVLEREKLARESLENSTKDENLLTSSSLVSVHKGAKIQKRIICLDKECWEFMGLVSINKKTVVTLLSKNKKKSQLKTFKVGDNLFENLKITRLEGDSMIVFDEEKEKKFILKLFDINVSAYSYKNIDERVKDKNE